MQDTGSCSATHTHLQWRQKGGGHEKLLSILDFYFPFSKENYRCTLLNCRAQGCPYVYACINMTIRTEIAYLIKPNKGTFTEAELECCRLALATQVHSTYHLPCGSSGVYYSVLPLYEQSAMGTLTDPHIHRSLPSGE